MRALALVLLTALCMLPHSRAHAQETGAGSDRGVSTEVAPLEDTGTATETVVDAVDPTGGAHRGSIATGRYGGLSATSDDAGAAPSRAASTDVRRAGPPGAPALLTVRGGEPSHTRTTLAGMPLDGAYDAGFNLALLPAPLLGQFQLYRSNVPLHLGPPGLGGVLAIELADKTNAGFVIGGGSWRRHRFAALSTHERGNATTTVGAVWQGAENRFPYFDQNGTPFTSSDDRQRRRQNAAFEQASALAVQRWRTPARSVDLFMLTGASERGVAGLGRVETRAATLSETRGDLGLRVRGPRGARSQMQTLAWLSAGNRVFRDPLGEFSARRGSTTEDLALRAGVSAQPLVLHNEYVRSRWLVELEAQRWSATRGHASGINGATRVRFGSGAEVSAALHPRVTLGVTLRLDVARDRDDHGTQWSILPAPQAGLGLRLLATERSTLDLSFTTAFVARAPSFGERFADVGQSIGNPELRSESRFGGDSGLTLASRVGAMQMSATAGVYLRRANDLIVFVETGSGARRAENVASAQLMGAELEVSVLAWGALKLAVDYTAQSARDADTGARLPYRADHQGSVALGVSRQGFSCELALDAVSWRAVDRLNFARVPRRLTVDAELGVDPVQWHGWGLGLAAQNLANQRSESVPLRDGGERRFAQSAVADFVGAPLPGRSLFATLRYRSQR